jgi:hypothetical protein
MKLVISEVSEGFTELAMAFILTFDSWSGVIAPNFPPGTANRSTAQALPARGSYLNFPIKLP